MIVNLQHLSKAATIYALYYFIAIGDVSAQLIFEEMTNLKEEYSSGTSLGELSISLADCPT